MGDIEIPIIEFIFVHLISYLCGIGTGLSICCRYKDKFMQREKSVEDLSRYNHQNLMPSPNTIMAQPSAPTITEITLK